MFLGSIIIIGLLIVIAIVVAVKVLTHKRLNPAQREIIEREWKHVESLANSSAKILEAEKVFHHLLKMNGHEGSFGDTLKEIGDAVPNQQAVWDAHKLRNRIAHEPGFSVNEADTRRAVAAFERAIRGML